MFIRSKLLAGVSLPALLSALEDGDQPERLILQTATRPRSSLQLAKKRNYTLYRRVGYVVLIAIFPLTVVASEPNDYVFLPGVAYREREIDFKLGTWKQSEEGRTSAASVGFGYGVTQRWFTEFYSVFQHTGDRGTHFDAGSGRTSFSSRRPASILLTPALLWRSRNPTISQEDIKCSLARFSKKRWARYS